MKIALTNPPMKPERVDTSIGGFGPDQTARGRNAVRTGSEYQTKDTHADMEDPGKDAGQEVDQERERERKRHVGTL